MRPPVTASTDLAALQARLASRRSISHFAHAAISLLIAVVLSCAIAKLYWDDGEADVPWFVSATVLYIYGITRWMLGRRALREEVALFDQMRALRSSLSLDDPAQLLPRA